MYTLYIGIRHFHPGSPAFEINFQEATNEMINTIQYAIVNTGDTVGPVP